MAGRTDLSKLQAFKSVPRGRLLHLARLGHRRTLASGRPLLRQGEPGDCLYIVLKGCLRAERSHPALLEPLTLANLGPGEVLGAAGTLAGSPNPFTVTAIQEVEVLELRDADLSITISHCPEIEAALLTLRHQLLNGTHDGDLVDTLEPAYMPDREWLHGTNGNGLVALHPIPRPVARRPTRSVIPSRLSLTE